METRKKYLPIGSVVLLKDDTRKLMIIGFCASAVEDDDQKQYDYSGCMYPEGLISSDEIYLFDHDQIEKINFIGYETEEEQEFKKNLIETLNEENNTVNNIVDYDKL